MKNLFKSMFAIIMVLAIMVSFSTPVMATEPEWETANNENVSPCAFLATWQKSNVTIKTGRQIGEKTINGRTKTIEWVVSGSGALVIFKMNNTDTGDFRTFSTVGNGVNDSITFTSPMDSGHWTISIEYVSNPGTFDVTFYFYS